jgi:hypothetical protein
LNPKGNPNLQPGPGRPKGTPNKITTAAKEIAESILDDEYMARLRTRILAGKAPHMETLLWQYAKGKPKGDESESPQNTLINVLAILGNIDQGALRQIRDAMKQLPEKAE